MAAIYWFVFHIYRFYKEFDRVSLSKFLPVTHQVGVSAAYITADRNFYMECVSAVKVWNNLKVLCLILCSNERIKGGGSVS